MTGAHMMDSEIPIAMPVKANTHLHQGGISIPRRRKERPSNLDGSESICSFCNKIFARRCDLTKHEKTHSRPWKCQEPDCKYHEHGWPTEKERDRHFNDKHSEKPPAFYCHFPPCKYSSKRESNCKQHMEKSHGWEYRRSKRINHKILDEDSSAKQYRSKTPLDPFDLELSPFEDSPSATPKAFVNSKDGCVDDLFGASVVASSTTSKEATPTYLPWPSPQSKLQEIQNVLKNIGAFHHDLPDLHDDTESENGVDFNVKIDSVSPSPLFGIDEQPQSTFVYHRYRRISLSPDDTESPLRDVSNIADHIVSTLIRDSKIETDGSEAHSSSKKDDASSDVMASKGKTSSTQANITRPSKRARESDQPDDNEDNENSQPRKHAMLEPPDDDCSDGLPCIYYVFKPDIYNINNDWKYKSCHTKHNSVSSLMRHLERPAHGFTNCQHYISQFAVDEDIGHSNGIALCKNCFKPFPDRDSIRRHLSLGCRRVSRGMVEKWRIMYHQFCIKGADYSPLTPTQLPLHMIPEAEPASPVATRANRAPSQSLQQPYDQSPERIQLATPNREEGLTMNPFDSQGASQSFQSNQFIHNQNQKMALESPDSASSTTNNIAEVISMKEHLALCERVSILEESNRKLTSMTVNLVAMILGQSPQSLPSLGQPETRQTPRIRLPSVTSDSASSATRPLSDADMTDIHDLISAITSNETTPNDHRGPQNTIASNTSLIHRPRRPPNLRYVSPTIHRYLTPSSLANAPGNLQEYVKNPSPGIGRIQVEFENRKPPPSIDDSGYWTDPIPRPPDNEPSSLNHSDTSRLVNQKSPYTTSAPFAVPNQLWLSDGNPDIPMQNDMDQTSTNIASGPANVTVSDNWLNLEAWPNSFLSDDTI